MKNKNVKKLLAGLLTVSTVAGAYALGDKLIDFRPVSPDNETKIAGTMQKDEGMSPIPNIFDYLEEKTKETEEVTEETQDTQPEEIHEEEIPSVDVDTPEEKGLTLTGKTNTRNDNLVSGEVCINNSDFELPNDVKRALNKAISDIQNKGLKVGFYLTDIDTNMTISYNGNTDFQPASSVKAGMALYAVKQIEAGQFSFDDKMKYEAKHHCGGSGNIQNYAYGTEFTLKDIIHSTINVSDNIGYYMLYDKFGHQGYNEMISDLGCKTWFNGYTKWGYLTPQELNLIWQEIYAYGQESEYGKWLFDEFLNAEYNFVKKCLPEYQSAHKSGFNPQGFHDSAVVFGKRNYIVTVMTTQSWWTIENMDKILEALDDAVNAYDDYMLEKNAQDEIIYLP